MSRRIAPEASARPPLQRLLQLVPAAERLVQAIERHQGLVVLGRGAQDRLERLDRAVGLAELALEHVRHAQAQRARPPGVRSQIRLALEGIDDLGPQADPPVEPCQRLAHAGQLLAQARLGGVDVVAGLGHHALERVDGLVGLLKAPFVDVGQLALARASGRIGLLVG